jgi:acetylornithine aminotransferase
MLGIVLTAPAAAAVERSALDRRVLVNAAAPDVVRLVPPLVLTDADIDLFLSVLPSALDEAAGVAGGGAV